MAYTAAVLDSQIDVSGIRDLLVQGDAAFPTINFTLPAGFTGLTWRVRGTFMQFNLATQSGELTSTGSTTISIAWPVGSNFTTYYGEMQIVLVGTDALGNIVTKATGYVNVQRDYSISTVEVVDENLFEQLMAELSSSSVMLDQTTEQEIINGVPKLAADRVISDDHHLVDKKHVADVVATVTADDFNHNDLANKQGGTTDEFYHVTAAEKTVIEHTSGTNTGDQDVSGAISTHNTDAGAHAGLFGAVNTNLSVVTDDIYLRNESAGLRKWRLFKAKVDAGIGQIYNLNILSDSIGEGKSELSATAANYEKGWVGRLKTYLSAKYGDIGSGFIGNRFPAGGTSLATYTGTWSTSIGIGWMDSSWTIYGSSTAGDSVSIPFSGTGIVLMAHTSSTNPSSASVVIDGGAPVTWDLYKAPPSAVTTKAITGLMDGAHTCVVTLTAGRYQSVGHYSTKGSNGIRVNRLSVGGAKATMIAYELQYLSCIDYWTPTLTIIDMIANDYNSQTPIATYTQQLRAIVARAKTFGDVLIFTAGDIFNATKVIPISDYKAASLSVAIEYGCAYLDAGKAFGNTYAVANAYGYLADEVHPTSYAHQDLCNMVVSALGL